MTKEIIFSDATKLAELIRTKEVSPVEVVQAHLDRIAAVNPKINAIVTLADGALKAAKAAEAAVLAGDELGPLHGVPFTGKDCRIVSLHAPVICEIDEIVGRTHDERGHILILHQGANATQFRFVNWPRHGSLSDVSTVRLRDFHL